MTDKAPPATTQSALLEQYLLLAKTAKGAAAVELIKQVLEAPGVYVFGELLNMPGIGELSVGPHSSFYQLLHLFAYGKYANYLENKNAYPSLTPAMVNKLRHLTIVSLATKSKCIPYSTLLRELDLRNLRELEDLIIEVIYADVVRGKLDQKNNQLEIDYTIGRDIRPEDVNTIISVLQEWSNSCKAVLNNIECQITRANALRDSHIKMKLQVEAEIGNIRKTLKSQTQEGDDQMNADMRDGTQADKPTKKQAKSKGLRGSGKFWQKS